MRLLPPTVLLAAPMLLACSDTGLVIGDRTELFQQSDTDVTVDILWVMDNSGTMAEEQGLVLASASRFIDALEEGRANFHLGVTTTDVRDPLWAGVLEGAAEERVLDPTTPDLTTAFLDRLSVGVWGDRDEQGMEAVSLALSQNAEAMANAGMFRDEATLHLFFISDEDDHSAGAVPDYLHEWRTASPAGIVVTALVGDLPAGCLANQAAADAGTRYIDAVARTDGVLASICMDDYGEFVEELGLRVLELQHAWVLQVPANPDTIEVWVDDIAIPRRPRHGWRYDPSNNSVAFTGFAVPDPGQEIRVHYRIAAGSVSTG